MGACRSLCKVSLVLVLLAVFAGGALAQAPAGGKQRAAMDASSLVGHGGPIKAIASDTQGKRALTGSFDYAMMVWDLAGETPRLLHRLEDHDGAVNAVAFVPGSQARRALAGSDDGRLALWDVETGTLVHRFEGHTAKVVGVAATTDGRWAATASWDRTARLWDLVALRPGPVLEGHTGPVNAVTFSADGTRVFTAGYDGVIAVHEVATGRFLRPVHKHGWGVNVLLRLPDADPTGNKTRLAFGALNGAGGIIDPDAQAGTLMLDTGDRPILAVSAVGQPGLVALASADGMIRVFRSDDGAPIEAYQNPYGPVWALAFLVGGTQLYYGGLDDFATRWQVAPRKPFEPAQGEFPRRFQVTGNEKDDLVAQGALQFARKCSICHTLEPDGRNRAGPTLHKIFGRRIATLPDYPYSEALKGLDIVWTPDTVSRLFELGPDVFTPGSKMPLQKMTDASQRAALVAYLKAKTDSTGASQPLPEAPGSSR